jgi:predicted CopG family antitoxin
VVIESLEARGRRGSRFKRIVISERNYLALKKLGYAGDSFNDVISKLLRIERSYQEMKKQQEEQQEGADDNSSNSGSEFLFPPTSTGIFSEKQNKKQLDEIVRLLRGKKRGKCSMDNHQTSQQESNR